DRVTKLATTFSRIDIERQQQYRLTVRCIAQLGVFVDLVMLVNLFVEDLARWWRNRNANGRFAGVTIARCMARVWTGNVENQLPTRKPLCRCDVWIVVIARDVWNLDQSKC